MNQLPLVSVICLCHNHERFVAEAILSVEKQSYPNIELIVVDDGSTDGSKVEIQKTLKDTQAKFIDIPYSIGNCAAFNRGFSASRGAYVIDLAADDCLLPERVLAGINTFISTEAGVTFSDVMMIDEEGQWIQSHFLRDEHDRLIEPVPEGDIYEKLIKKYFISPPSMMIKREVLEDLKGYDEKLTYEDFDFWIRSSRKYQYAFTNEILVKKRVLPNSLSTQQFKKKTIHQWSTLQVCKKIKELNRSSTENKALTYRCIYEIKQCVKQRNWKLIPAFLKLL